VRHTLLAFAISSAWLWAAVGLGTDFRVESTTFSGTKKEPVSSSTTLFHVGIVYDYLADPPQVAILDPARGRFILLDVSRREKTEITTAEVATFATNMQSWAAKAPNLFLRFAAKPKFETTTGEDPQELVFTASSMVYRVKGLRAPSADAAQQYREFSDWYLKLNAMTNPAILPPFPRIAVNEELANRGVVPESVALDIPKQISFGGRGMSLHSEHIVTWRLLQKDLDDIATTGSQMADFSKVTFAEFRKAQRK
jgi:hypothetical protein